MQGWHLDKKVPIGLIIAIAVQTISFIGWAAWWSSSVEERFNSTEQRFMETENRIKAAEETNRRQYDIINADRRAARDTSNRLAKVEGLLQSIDAQVRLLVSEVVKAGNKDR